MTVSVQDVPIGCYFKLENETYLLAKHGQCTVTAISKHGTTVVLNNDIAVEIESEHGHLCKCETCDSSSDKKPQKDKELGKFKQHLYRVTIARKLWWNKSDRLYYYTNIGRYTLRVFNSGDLQIFEWGKIKETKVKFEKLLNLIIELEQQDNTTSELTKILEKM